MRKRKKRPKTAKKETKPRDPITSIEAGSHFMFPKYPQPSHSIAPSLI